MTVMAVVWADVVSHTSSDAKLGLLGINNLRSTLNPKTFFAVGSGRFTGRSNPKP